MVHRSSYLAAGGHAGVAKAMHDGMKLAANFRRKGFGMDFVDATPLAECRMYRNVRDLWLGFGKNASEGMAKPIALPFWTLLLGAGLVAPFFLAPYALPRSSEWDAMLLLSSLASLVPSRTLQGIKCREPFYASALLPLGVVVTIAIQWNALIGYLLGYTVVWRDRI